MIIGRDMIEFLGINIRFYDQTIEWDSRMMPFKYSEDAANGIFHVDEPEAVVEANDRIKRILDAKAIYTGDWYRIRVAKSRYRMGPSDWLLS